MAITTVGFDNADITEAGFSRLMAATGKVANDQGVTSGLVASAGGGTRQVSITAGEALAPGLLVTSDATATVSLAANSSGAARTDYVVLEVNWGTNTAAFAAVTGSSSTAPTLVQTAGSTWQIPLARVAVANGQTTLTSTDVVVSKPLPRQPVVYVGTVSATTINHNDAATAVSTVAVSDPGWPYRLLLIGSGRFSSAGSGFAQLNVDVESTTVKSGQSPRLDLGGPMPAHVEGTSAVLTGPTTARLRIVALSMASTDDLTLNSAGMNQFTVHQIPA